MTIDASLDTLMLPALPTYQNEFGTKRLDGGLTTAECTDGIMIWGRRQRPFPVTETSITTKVDANCTFDVTTAGIELTISDATFNGCKATVINSSNGDIRVKGGVSGLNGQTKAVVIPQKEMMSFTFFSGWHSDILSQYPKGMLVWFSAGIDPNDRFGGTWIQIKDKFILAAGDTYQVDESGGTAQTTLTEENLPSHTHSFTPEGSVSAHSHGLNNHTHSFNWSGSHGHDVVYSTVQSMKEVYYFSGQTNGIVGNSVSVDSGREHTNATGYIMAKPTTISVSGTTGGNSGNTASDTPTFTGVAGTTGATGSGTAFCNMPPYVGKYCWERTA